MYYRCNAWKHFSWLLRNLRSQKMRHKGQNVECQLAKEDDFNQKVS